MIKFFKKYFVFWCISAICLLVVIVSHYMPILIENSGKIMRPIGEYGSFKYAVVDIPGPDSGLYVSQKSKSNYKKITNYYPKLALEVGYCEDTLYFVDTGTGGGLVKYDAVSGKVLKKSFGEHELLFLAVNSKHFIAQDAIGTGVYSFNTNNFELECSIGKYIPIDIKISNNDFKFTDKLTGKRLKYSFDTSEVIAISQ